MTPAEVARVLAAIQSRDLRTVGQVDVMAWHEDIGDLEFGECLPAVSHHFRTSDARIMPVHIRRFVEEQRRDRAMRDRARELTATAERADVLPPGELQRQIDEAVAAARERKARTGSALPGADGE